MSVVTAIEDAGPCRKKLTLEIPATAVEAELGRVTDEYHRSLNLPGFRRGKAPIAIVRQRFRKEIEGATVERLLPRYWKQAQAEQDLEPLMAPELEPPTLIAGAPLQVVLFVEARPEITLGDIKTFALPEAVIEASETDIDDFLGGLRRSHGEWLPVERAAAVGDAVVGKVRDLGGHAHDHGGEEADHSHGEEPEGDGFRPLHIEIGAKGVDEELSLLLTGATPGKKLRYKKSHGEGETAHIHEHEIEVEAVKELILPEADDSWAKKMGDFDTIEDLRKVLARTISQRKGQELRRARETALLDQLRERHPLALPEGVLNAESENLMREWVEDVSQRGVDLDRIDWQGLAGEVRPMAEKRVHARLLLDAIARAEGIRLDENRFERFLTAAASQQKTSSMALRQRLAEDGRLEGLRSQMLRDQTLSHLLGENPDADEASELDSAED